jgi:DNA adenine methylase
MGKNKLVAPFLKWVGGKRQIIPAIAEHLPKTIKVYIEPFIGGGALLFHLQPKRAIINDFNSELVNVYSVIKNDLESLIIDLKKHKNESDYFYKIRGIDRTGEIEKLTNAERASRIIYLNKTCFNGLYRVNSSGEFNSPFGKYKNPNIINEPTLRAVNHYLNTNDIQIINGDYLEILQKADKNSFVYLDPPYHPVSESSNFTGYVQGGWDESDQVRLREACDDLTKRGINFLQSNSSADFIKQQYTNYSVHTIKANRAINSNGEKRGEVEELLIKNYD